jgi:hypothetical protein
VWPVRTSGTAGTVELHRTGQTTSYTANDDGALQKGVAWPSSRFTVEGDIVKDALTGLIWSLDANVPGPGSCAPGEAKTWQAAFTYVNCLNTNNYLGFKDWRLPNLLELTSLIDMSRYSPAIPSPHPFANMSGAPYEIFWWTADTLAGNTSFALATDLGLRGATFPKDKSNSYSVWPVRGGTFSIATSAGTYGSITTTSTQPLTSGESRQFTITPDTGHGIATITGCSGSLSGTTFTTSGISKACTLIVTFTAYDDAMIGSTPYGSIATAFAAVGSSETIMVRAVDFTEHLNFNRSVTYKLAGGYNSGYSAVSGTTAIHGSVTISAGTVTMDGITIL